MIYKMLGDAYEDNTHLHPDIFAMVAIYVGEYHGGPDFCAWVSTCKRAQRLSKRADVSMIACMLQNAYYWQDTARISDQIILPHDLICKMIKCDPSNWFDLQTNQCNFEICKLACKYDPYIVLRLREKDCLTVDEQIELWCSVISQHPYYINDVENRWTIDHLVIFRRVKIGPNVTIKILDEIRPLSSFAYYTIQEWKRQVRNRDWWRKFREDVMYCTIGGMISGVCNYHKGASMRSAIMSSIMTTIGSILLRSL